MGGEAKVTVMVLKVDLDCEKCYKKVKKVLCKFPQIRDQVFDDKKNTVTIRVVCCSPEKIRDKLCCKGGGSIKSIEIKEPEKSKVAEKPKESADKPKEEAEKRKATEKPKQVTFAGVVKDSDNKMEPQKAKEAEKPKDAEKKEKPKDAAADKPKPSSDAPKLAATPEPVKVVAAAHAVQGYPSMYPISTQYYDGYSAGPSYNMYGGGQQGNFIQYDGYYGRPVYDSWAGNCNPAGGYNYNRNHNYNRSGYEENPTCTIM